MKTSAMTPRRKLETARLVAVQNAPYFRAAIYGLVWQEAPDLVDSVGNPTLAVSEHGVLFWNPAAVETRFDIEELAGAFLHEIGHVLRHHHARSKAYGITDEDDRRIANAAQDACINEDLRTMHDAIATAPRSGQTTRANPFKVGADWIYPEKLEQPPGLVWEERYRLLKERPHGAGGGGGIGSGDCGSCAARPHAGEPQGGGASIGRSPANMMRIRRQVAETVRAWKGRGLIPGGWKRWADSVLRPSRVNWRSKLAHTIRAQVGSRPGAARSTWTKVSRRQGGLGFGPGRAIVSASDSPTPDVAVIIDTSGSMSKVELTAAAVEVRSLLQDVGARVTVCIVDAEVHGLKEVKTVEQAIEMMHGGGGTSMSPGFKALADRRPRPAVVIVLTDGLIGDGHPAVEPSWCKTVWTRIGGPAEPCCPWGEFVHVPVGEEEEEEDAA
jgi:predicted metal-dependent peptidase